MSQATPIKRILIMAGGTGGHVIPALTVAAELQQQGCEVFWLGTRRGLESQLVTKAGIPLKYIDIQGIRGKGWLGWLTAPFKILYAVWQAHRVIRELRPNSVLGMGGFVSGPGGIAAWLNRIPLIIHEQNAIAGMTNRYLARVAARVCEAFPNTFPTRRKKTITTGNPVRSNIATLPQPQQRLQPSGNILHILVLGGSQGARMLNRVVPESLSLLPGDSQIEVRHQTGQQHVDNAKTHYRAYCINASIEPFIEDMMSAYAWADLVICRAGALTIAEVAAVGVAAILVPYPHAVDDHQTVNAHYLTDAKAAILLPETQLTALALANQINTLYADRQTLLNMAIAARDKANIHATHAVVAACLAAYS
jgi:UDP-N-acetylglucosamine--N-acetylmuramyl-(pentapeptide) pyrophosphoryl-undecaprenol N-acetylglucosamine transferase